MAPKRASLAFWLAVLSLSCLSARADDDKKPQPKGTAAPPGAAKGGAPSPAQLKEMLTRSLTMVQETAADGEKRERRFEVPDVSVFLMRFTKPLEADVLRAIGRAQARLGGIADARTSWQLALDAIAATTLEDVSERVDIILKTAEAQVEAGEKDESRFTIRQALQLVRSLGSQPKFPAEMLPPPGMEPGPDASVTSLLRIARVQDRSGDKAGCNETFRKAAALADSIKAPSQRIQAQVELAAGAPGGLGGEIWDRAVAFSLEQKDEYERYRGIETIVRGQVKAGRVEPALAVVTGRLGGDLKGFVVWAIADAIASGDMLVAPELMERLERQADEGVYDRPSKKLRVHQRIAEARARLGDYEGAYHTIGLVQPDDGNEFITRNARNLVMAAVAEAQLAAKQVEAARETSRTALETIAPMAGENSELVLPLTRFGSVLARSGDIRGAEEIVELLSRGRLKVELLVAIADAHAERKHDAEARDAIRRAVEATRRVPNDELWEADIVVSPGFFLNLSRQKIATAQARIGDLDSALRTIAEFGDSNSEIFVRKAVMEEVVNLRLAANDIVGARRALELLPPRFAMFLDDRAVMQERIARHEARQSDPMAVLELARKEPTPRGKLQLLRGLADGIADRLTRKDAQKGAADH